MCSGLFEDASKSLDEMDREAKGAPLQFRAEMLANVRKMRKESNSSNRDKEKTNDNRDENSQSKEKDLSKGDKKPRCLECGAWFRKKEDMWQHCVAKSHKIDKGNFHVV